MPAKSTGKVLVGLSGGVDSSVSAALLKKEGYDVTGAFIKVWSPEWMPCTWCEERRDAMRVAAALDIPFMTVDLAAEYKKAVADYMIDEYRRGRTPNPDVMCNKEIKFGAFLARALELGFDYVATGHYARVIPPYPRPLSLAGEGRSFPSPVKEKGPRDEAVLLEGLDEAKDQSYFLWTLAPEQLSHILFPVGHLEKSGVRALAKKFKLPTAEKKDSQGICFLGRVDMKEFLSHYIAEKMGKVLDEAGNEIGDHDGAAFLTIGERHGFSIGRKTPNDEPYYIVAKDMVANTVTVAHKKQDAPLQAVRSIALSSANWIRMPEPGKSYAARIRYRQEKQACRMERGEVRFDRPQSGVSVGQSLVLYDGDACLGGGIIESFR